LSFSAEPDFQIESAAERRSEPSGLSLVEILEDQARDAEAPAGVVVRRQLRS
jgi:hypothetical protein